MTNRCIEPAKGPVDAAFLAVPSKSATHRALVAAALAEGTSAIKRPLDADDTRRTLEGLRQLGVAVDAGSEAWVVHGAGGRLGGGGSIDLGASGTSARFLTALATLGNRVSTLDGVPRLSDRPMHELIQALTELGATISTSQASTFPLRAGGFPVRGGSVVVSGERSSQFTSALLLAAPGFERGLQLEVAPPRVSSSYVRMTVEMLETFGARVATTADARFVVPSQRLRATTVEIEGDYSSASYFFAAAAIVGGRVVIRGLRPESAQPDARFPRDLASVGCRVSYGADDVVVEGTGRVSSFVWDLTDAPDLAPTAAVLALFAEGPCTLTGLRHLALKESDRLSVLQENLVRLGARASVANGTLSIVPPSRDSLRGGPIRVAGDHRIAMAFATAGLASPGIAIDEPGVVAKSYPRFWNDLAALVRTGS